MGLSVINMGRMLGFVPIGIIAFPDGLSNLLEDLRIFALIVFWACLLPLFQNGRYYWGFPCRESQSVRFLTVLA